MDEQQQQLRSYTIVSKLVLCLVLCQIVSLQYLSRWSLHRLAGLLCRIFLPHGLQVVTREVNRSSLRRFICPVQDHFIFSHIADYDFCLLPDSDACWSFYHCRPTSFHFGLCGCKFVLCMLGQWSLHHAIAGSTHVGVVGPTRSLLKISRCLAYMYAAQSAMILRCRPHLFVLVLSLMLYAYIVPTRSIAHFLSA